MDDTEQEQFHDDVEITDIPEEDTGNRQPGWLRCRSEASLLRFRRLSPRQRSSYLAATLGIIVLVVIIIVGSSPGARDALDVGVFGRAPTPTATLAPGTDLFYMDGIPSWGQAYLDGHVIARDQSNSADHPLELSITWDGTNWHVGIVFNHQVASQADLACLSAEEAIGSTGEYSITGGIVGDGAPVNWQFSAGSNLAAGCLASGTPSNVTATPTTLAPAFLLDRFGVILAANQSSREYWLQLPIADKYEQQLARQLTTQSSFQ